MNSHKSVLKLVSLVATISLLAGCLPAKERSLDMGEYYDVTYAGRPLERSEAGFVRSTSAYDLVIDLGQGNLDVWGVLSGPPFVQVAVTNKLDSDIALDWNASVFILQSGVSTKLIDFDSNLTYMDRPFELEVIEPGSARRLLATTPAAFGSDAEFMFIPAAGLLPIYSGRGPTRAFPLLDTRMVRSFGLQLAVVLPDRVDMVNLTVSCNAEPTVTTDAGRQNCPTVR